MKEATKETIGKIIYGIMIAIIILFALWQFIQPLFGVMTPEMYYGQYLTDKEKEQQKKIQENEAKINKLQQKNTTTSESGGAIPGLTKIKK